MSSILSIVGLINTGYLYYLHLNASIGCGLGSNCQDVITSSYGSLFNLPVAVFGISLYLVLIVLQALESKNEIDASSTVSFKLFLLTPAAAIAIILFALQFISIGAFCPFCSLNTLIILILFWTLL